MSFVIPDASDIKARFPAMANADDGLLDLMIAEATPGYVDESWEEADFPIAIQYLVAHWWTTNGGNSGGGAAQGVIASESFGGMSRSFFQHGGTLSIAEADLASTSYGRQYLLIRKRNFTGPVVV